MMTFVSDFLWIDGSSSINKTDVHNKTDVWCMMFNPTFNNISAISWWSVLLVEKTTERQQVTNKLDRTCIEHTSPWTALERTTLVVICTDCTRSCKSNYHMITEVYLISTCNINNTTLNDPHHYPQGQN